MERTSSKYNRYTRFALRYLDSMMVPLEHETIRCTDSRRRRYSQKKVIGSLWDHIVSVHFIPDYLQRKFLRNHQDSAPVAIKLIVRESLCENGVLNEDSLFLMVQCPRVLFHFELILDEALESSDWGKDHLIHLLEFIVDQRLMTWAIMLKTLRFYVQAFSGLATEHQVIDNLQHYVWIRHLNTRSKIPRGSELRNNRSGNPLPQRRMQRQLKCIVEETKDIQHANPRYSVCECCNCMWLCDCVRECVHSWFDPTFLTWPPKSFSNFTCFQPPARSSMLWIFETLSILHVSRISASISLFCGHKSDVARHHLWCYLEWQDRLRLRAVCTSFHDMHCDLFHNESIKITEFHKLSNWIKISDPSHLETTLKFWPYDIRAALPDHNPLPYEDKLLIDKIIADIAERSLTFADAAIICTNFLNSIHMHCVWIERNGWPSVTVHGTIRSCKLNVYKLCKIFKLAVHEMEKTLSKYNRYTRFAFTFLDSMLLTLDHDAKPCLDGGRRNYQAISQKKVIRSLWDQIVSVHFIPDYLQRELLRNHQGTASNAIRLIVRESLCENGMLNEDPLLLIVQCPRILFDLELILCEALESRDWGEDHLAQLVDFIVDHGLMSWPIMLETLEHFIWNRREKHRYNISSNQSRKIVRQQRSGRAHQSQTLFRRYNSWKRSITCCCCMWWVDSVTTKFDDYCFSQKSNGKSSRRYWDIHGLMVMVHVNNICCMSICCSNVDKNVRNRWFRIHLILRSLMYRKQLLYFTVSHLTAKNTLLRLLYICNLVSSIHHGWDGRGEVIEIIAKD